MKPQRPSRQPRAFSLVELLVVIAIIGIVIAILIPALRGARIQARKVATMSTMNQLNAACAQFVSDHKRNPGFFTPAQMGDSQNASNNGGFTGMQNVLLDLAGGVTKAPAQAGVVFDVGPGGAATVMIDITKIGASGQGKGYFNPDKSALVADPGLNGTANNKLMPQVVDAFGNPILAWLQDERPSGQFASDNASTPARFYWASNYGVLASAGIGRDRRDQSDGNNSMLASALSANDRAITMASLLGNPAMPLAGSNPMAPAAARGPVVFHSAGPDGYFMGRNDRGTKVYGSTGSPNVPYRSGNDIDVMNDYDDLKQAAGN